VPRVARVEENRSTPRLNQSPRFFRADAHRFPTSPINLPLT
jgi:hypothetical protein